MEKSWAIAHDMRTKNETEPHDHDGKPRRKNIRFKEDKEGHTEKDDTPSKKITFKEGPKEQDETYYEPDNFKIKHKRRTSIHFKQSSDVNDNASKGRSRYSLFISGIHQFDPYQELTPTQIAAFRQIFDLVDKDGGGSIDASELYHSLKDLEPNLNLNEITEIIEELDEEGNGTICFDAFLYLVTSMSLQIKEAAAHDDFAKAGKRRQSVFFSVITKFAKRHSLKEIERYYASKSRHTPHVVAHYAAGACVQGLSEKELRQEWRHLFLANKGKDSPYAQPLNFCITTARNKKSKQFKRSKRSPSPNLLTSSPPPYHSRYGSCSPDSIQFDTISSRCSSRSKSPGSSRPESRGWTPRHGLPITKVALPMVIYNRNKNRKKLTIIDMDKIRERITVARNCYYNQLNLENEEKATKYWETLKIQEIPSQRLRRNFLKVFRAYSPTNEYENHIINEKKNTSDKGKLNKQERCKRNTRSPVLLRL